MKKKAALPPKLPEMFCLGDDIWVVREVRRIPNSKGLRGLCDSESMVIYIQKGLSFEEKWKTFFHEIFHAFEYSFNITINHKLIYALESPVYDLIFQNWL